MPPRADQPFKYPSQHTIPFRPIFIPSIPFRPAFRGDFPDVREVPPAQHLPVEGREVLRFGELSGASRSVAPLYALTAMSGKDLLNPGGSYVSPARCQTCVDRPHLFMRRVSPPTGLPIPHFFARPSTRGRTIATSGLCRPAGSPPPTASTRASPFVGRTGKGCPAPAAARANIRIGRRISFQPSSVMLRIGFMKKAHSGI